MLKIFRSKIKKMPLIAILRGIEPADAATVSNALVENDFVFMEVTLNSPDWQESLKIIKNCHGNNIILGAGTVLSVDDVNKVHAVGGQVIISPNMDIDVIKRTKELGLVSAPGCATPSECFSALKAGADILKIFPAEILGVPFIKAISAVLPANTLICPTGGVNLDTMGDFMDAGVYAMGLGSALYKAGKKPSDLATSAAEFVAKYRELSRGKTN